MAISKPEEQEKQKVYYKVVQISPKGHRYSAFALPPHRLVYTKGKVVRGKGIGVMCFKTEAQAKTFRSRIYVLNSKIIEVEALSKPTKIPFWLGGYFGSDAISRYIKFFGYWTKTITGKAAPWQKGVVTRIKNESYGAVPPNGTICFKKIKVLT